MITLLRLNESRNNKLRVDVCCDKSQALLMCKSPEYKHENAVMFYHWAAISCSLQDKYP